MTTAASTKTPHDWGMCSNVRLASEPSGISDWSKPKSVSQPEVARIIKSAEFDHQNPGGWNESDKISKLLDDGYKVFLTEVAKKNGDPDFNINRHLAYKYFKLASMSATTSDEANMKLGDYYYYKYFLVTLTILEWLAITAMNKP